MPDNTEDTVNTVIADAIGEDPKLAARLIATDTAATLARLAPNRSDLPNADQLFAALTGPPLPPETIAERLGLDVDAVHAVMEGNPDDLIEIDPTNLQGFDDAFGPTDEEN